MLREELRAAIAAHKERGHTKTQAADELRISRNTVRKYWDVPYAAPAEPTDHRVRGHSTLYDANGDVKLQWVKTQVAAERFEERAKEYVAALVADIVPLKPSTKQPSDTRGELMTAYVIGDAHIGMLAWGDETGENFDTSIAAADLKRAMDIMVSEVPASQQCIICNMGDYYHMDDRTNMTPGGKNALDVDGRYLQVMRVGIQAMRYLIDRALEKHTVVRVRNVAGNHDPHSSITLTLAITALYDHEPRVIVEDSPRSFWGFTFGNSLIALTHGDQIKKPEAMAMFLASQYPKEWGACEFKYVWQGHIHHLMEKEHGGVIVRAFRTLASSDAWHAGKGFVSGQELEAITLHEQWGKTQTNTVPILRVRTGERR